MTTSEHCCHAPSFLTKELVRKKVVVFGNLFHGGRWKVVSLGILPYIQWLNTFCQGTQLSLLAFLVSSNDLDIRMGKSMADGMSLPRLIANELLHCGQTHPEPTRGSPRS